MQISIVLSQAAYGGASQYAKWNNAPSVLSFYTDSTIIGQFRNYIKTILNRKNSITGVVYKKTDKLPVTNYEISLEAERLEGLDFFCGLTFPVGSLKTCMTLVMGGWGGSVTGLSSIDGMDASENSTGHYRRFEDKKWYRVKVRVTPANITVWSNDEKIIDLDTAGRKLGLRAGPIEDYAPLSLTTYQTTAAIRNVKVKTLPGK